MTKKQLTGFIIVAGFIGLLLLIMFTYGSQPDYRSNSATSSSTATSVDEQATAEAWRQLEEWLANATTTTTTLARPTATKLTQLTADASVWDRLAWCESSGRWDLNTGNGYGGGLQFAHGTGWSTWRAFGGLDYALHPWEASREQQIAVAERVLERSGWKAWPGCARKLGLL